MLSDSAATSGAISSSREDRLRGGQWERPADSAWSFLTALDFRSSAVQGRLGHPYLPTGLGNRAALSAIATSAFGSKRNSQSAIARRLLFEEPNKLSGSSRHIPQLAFPHRHHSPALFFERCDVTLISRPIPRQLGMPVVSIASRYVRIDTSLMVVPKASIH